MRTKPSHLVYTLAILLAINTMNFFDRQILPAVQEKIDWDLSDSQLGALGTAFILINPAGLTPAGWSLLDAVRDTELPFAVVHISQFLAIDGKERPDIFADTATSYISGAGWRGGEHHVPLDRAGPGGRPLGDAVGDRPGRNRALAGPCARLHRGLRRAAGDGVEPALRSVLGIEQIGFGLSNFCSEEFSVLLSSGAQLKRC